MRVLKIIFHSIVILLSMILIGNSVKEINEADTWLELIRGVFWVAVGAYAFWASLDNIEDLK